MKKETLSLVIGEDQGEGNNRGVICAANSGNRFIDSHYSEGVTDFVVGCQGTDLAPLIAERDSIAPSVRVPRRFEFKKSKKGLAFLANENDLRAIGSGFNKVGDGRESVDAHVFNRGLTTTLDRDEMMDGDIEQAARSLTAILLRNSIKRGYALLAGTATNTGKVWGSAADPDGDVMEKMVAILEARGVLPNRAIYGSAAWLRRRTSYVGNDGDGTGALATLPPDQVAQAIAVEQLRISRAVAKSTEKGAKSLMLANKVFLYYADAVASRDDASNIKRFWSPTANGGDIAVYVNEKNKTVDVTVELYELMAVTDSDGILSLTVTAS